jgi:hypothetical protein
VDLGQVGGGLGVAARDVLLGPGVVLGAPPLVGAVDVRAFAVEDNLAGRFGLAYAFEQARVYRAEAGGVGHQMLPL